MVGVFKWDMLVSRGLCHGPTVYPKTVGTSCSNEGHEGRILRKLLRTRKKL